MQFFNKLRSNLFILAFNDKIVMNDGAWRLTSRLAQSEPSTVE